VIHLDIMISNKITVTGEVSDDVIWATGTTIFNIGKKRIEEL